MRSLSVIFLFCSFQISLALDISSLYERWQAEITQSLQRNIVGCPLLQQSEKPLEYIIHTKAPNNSFELHVINPTVEVTHLFNKFKPQLSLSNRNFSRIAQQLRGYDEKNYANTENAHSWAIPDEHPGQNQTNCHRLMLAASAGTPISIYDSYYPIDRSFYLLRISNGVVYHGGSVGTSCGRYIGKEGCDSRNDNQRTCHSACVQYLQSKNLSWFDLWQPQRFNASENADMLDQCMCLLKPRTKGYPWNITRTDKIFLSTAGWDYNYHHFLVDSLSRIAHHIPFLQHHPRVKIHFFGIEHFDIPYMSNDLRIHQSQELRYRLLDLLHIDRSRVLYNAVIANEVYIPRAMRCSHAASNPVEIRLLAMHLLKGSYRYIASHLDKLDPALLPYFNARRHNPPHSMSYFSKAAAHASNSSSSNSEKVMVILRRKSGDRSWSDSFTQQVHQALTERFTNFTIFLVDDGKAKADNYCLACDIFRISIADVLVGEHGAGLTNVMFMQTGSLLIETVAEIDGRHLPMCGYYNAMSGGMGIHHYAHAYASGHGDYFFRANYMANEAYDYFQNLTLYEEGVWHDFVKA